VTILRRPRAIFVSDVHLGTRGCKAEFLLDFLRAHEPEVLYLVGDIVDGWALRRSWHWPDAHEAVVAELLRKARHGVRVVYVPGNHDESLRPHLGTYAGIEVVREAEHVTADGRRFLVIHGDEHDAVVRNARWLALVGDVGYQAATHVNHWLNWGRRLLGLPYWSLAGFLKRNVKEALAFIDDFETDIARKAKQRGFDGVVAGHIHQACLREVEGITYANDGDWVDSCTALVEEPDGTLRVVDWMQERAMLLYAGRTWLVEVERGLAGVAASTSSEAETISAMR
jgi:UDP-2,3-diacylglucosamine pyrophosphatase LpxH